MPDHFMLFYASDLAASAPLDTVAAVARKSRAENQRAGITGLLVFDGEAFAQVLEGPEAAVRALLQRLKDDPRHHRIEVLDLAPVMSPRRFPTWGLGFVQMDLHESGIPGLRGKRGAAAMEAFNAMLPTLDIEMSRAMPLSGLRKKDAASVPGP